MSLPCKGNIYKVGGYKTVNGAVLHDMHYNHPLDFASMKITPEHKKSLMISEHDRMIAKVLVNANIPIEQVKKIIIFEGTKVSKINYQDARNWFWKNPISLDVDNPGYSFIKKIEDAGYLTRYASDEETNRLSSVFFTKENGMLNRARICNDVFIVDATYNINTLKIPLICVQGVSSVGDENLKSFPVALAFVCDETEKTYEWFFWNRR